MRVEEKINTETKVETAYIIGGSDRSKKSVICAEGTGKENLLATLEPSLENVGHQKSKGGPSRMERSPQVFAKGQYVWNTHL